MSFFSSCSSASPVKSIENLPKINLPTIELLLRSGAPFLSVKGSAHGAYTTNTAP